MELKDKAKQFKSRRDWIAYSFPKFMIDHPRDVSMLLALSAWDSRHSDSEFDVIKSIKEINASDSISDNIEALKSSDSVSLELEEPRTRKPRKPRAKKSSRKSVKKSVKKSSSSVNKKEKVNENEL